jgi:hypothetical protein
LKTVTVRRAKHLYLPFTNWVDEPVNEYVPAGSWRVNFPVEGTETENDRPLAFLAVTSPSDGRGVPGDGPPEMRS